MKHRNAGILEKNAARPAKKTTKPASRLIALLAALSAALPAAALDLGSIREDEVAVYVQDLQTGRVLAEHRADVPVNPASTMKLVTAFAALRALGGGFRWLTEFKSDGRLRPDGLLEGDLYWVGSGDPVFDQHDLLEMQAQLRDNGVKRIGGRLAFDRGVWTHTGTAADFTDDADQAFATAPDPQMLSYKVVWLTLGRDNATGAATIQTSPPLPGIPLHNLARFSRSTAPCPKPRKFVWGQYRDGVLTVRGNVPPSCAGKTVYVNMLDIRDFSRLSFVNQWQAGGGSIGDGLAVGGTPPKARTLASVYSKPLRDVLADMNKHSNNLIARTVFLTLGERASGGGVQNPAAAVRRQLQDAGINTAPLVLENGSGLSRQERLSARMLGHMLQKAYRSPFRTAFINTLPIAGTDGTLKNRFKTIGLPLRLKTGTLKNVRALAGYYLGGNGRPPLAVVVIINSERADKLLGEMDRLVERLVALPDTARRP
ncbi:MAG: D-alanyl-D-alanine carboxypeptidase/D-alanyl-D-alanine-endopeptidase [Neisseria sp.]|nr:D-alanyl-D-alanine carboxypeptidase/D-alanyl-D-alanine-endopeptidase [Neisseria sp.]